MAERTKEEIALLKKLNVSSFREVKKSQIIELATALDKMDPEVAKCIIAQVPQFVDLIKSASTDYKEEISNVVSNNQSSMDKWYENANLILKTIDRLLDKDEFTADQKLELVDKMIKLQEMMDKKDSENKTFLAGIATFIQDKYKYMLGLAGVAAILIGGSSLIKRD